MITARTGYGSGHRIIFREIFDHKPTNAEVREAQIKAGHHPNGYGGPDEIRTYLQPETQQWPTMWTCSASCD